MTGPSQAAALLADASRLLSLRQRDAARAVAEEAAAQADGDPRLLWAAGRILRGCNDPSRALALYARALPRDRDNIGLAYDLAAMQFYCGLPEDAERTIAELLARAPGMGHALYLRATLRRQRPDRNHVADLEARLAHGFADPRARAACLHALARELEDLEQHARSFAALAEATRLRRAGMAYDAAGERAAIDGIAAAYSSARMGAAAAAGGEGGEGAIFILGLPRTGSTLLERALVVHAGAAGAGELQDFADLLGAAARERCRTLPGASPADASLRIDFAALGASYMEGARQAAHGSACLVDKMPGNYMYCGAIHLALPRARIVHVVRDPMDTCYAIHKTLFHQAYSYSCDLRELADYYLAYRRLMAHWHQVMPGAILDVRYEDFVADPAGTARNVAGWCGLPWRDAPVLPSTAPAHAPTTTASAAQVREPVHARSVGSWRRHEAALAPLRERLAAAAVS